MGTECNMPPDPCDEPPDDDGHVDVQEAAKLLQVSRVVLEALLSKGRLGAVSTATDGSRLVLKSAVLEYKKRRRARRLAALEEVTDLTKEMGIYDAELVELWLQGESGGPPTK